jgi:hypothetical protein
MSDDPNLMPAATARAQLRRLGIAVDNLTDNQATALWADFLCRQIPAPARTGRLTASQSGRMGGRRPDRRRVCRA